MTRRIAPIVAALGLVGFAGCSTQPAVTAAAEPAPLAPDLSAVYAGALAADDDFAAAFAATPGLFGAGDELGRSVFAYYVAAVAAPVHPEQRRAVAPDELGQ